MYRLKCASTCLSCWQLPESQPISKAFRHRYHSRTSRRPGQFPASVLVLNGKPKRNYSSDRDLTNKTHTHNEEFGTNDPFFKHDGKVSRFDSNAGLETFGSPPSFQQTLTSAMGRSMNRHDVSSRPDQDWRKLKQKRFKSNPSFSVSEEVQDAIANHSPVVALETTIYTHGLPFPDNLSIAKSLEDIVRQHGAIPATIGIIDGIARIGLGSEELMRIALSVGKPDTMKVSRRDLPYILGIGKIGRKLIGGTTISGTMCLANQAGISVFGTGGLGGVHRGGQDSMDISADLTELGRTRVAVISSGCKSFLDIPRTLEYLETQGAGVLTFAHGRTGNVDYPAFFTRDSGVKSPMVVQNAKEAAAIIYASSCLLNGSGMHFANPIPEEFSIPKEQMDLAIQEAIQMAAEQGVHGHANTPFILAKIRELTKGRSVTANRALIESNVAIAAKVAVELSNFRKHRDSTPSHMEPVNRMKLSPPYDSWLYRDSQNRSTSSSTNTLDTDKTPKEPDVIVLGSVAIDISCDYNLPAGLDPWSDSTSALPRTQTSNPATIKSSIGGVGHNIALAIHRASVESVSLSSYVGDDLFGPAILSRLKEEGLDTSCIKVAKGGQTAQYVAINDAAKDLFIAVADMDVFAIKEPKLEAPLPKKWVIIDANWYEQNMIFLLHDIKHTSGHIKTAFEPVSVAKSTRIFELGDTETFDVYPNHLIDLATPNRHELAAMHQAARENDFFNTGNWWKIIDSLGIPSSGARDRFISITNADLTDQGIPLQIIQLLPLMPTILTKLGPQGVLLTELLKSHDPRLKDPSHAPYILSRSTNGSTENIGGVYMRLFPTLRPPTSIISVNGVGDTFLGVVIAGLVKGCNLDERLINIAQEAAVMTLESAEPVSKDVGRLGYWLDVLAEVTGMEKRFLKEGFGKGSEEERRLRMQRDSLRDGLDGFLKGLGGGVGRAEGGMGKRAKSTF